MRLERYLSPAKLALLSLGGTALPYLATLALGIASDLGRLAPGSLPCDFLLAWALPCVLGLVLMQTGKGALERGMISDRWPAQEIAALHERLCSALVRSVAAGSAVLGALCIFADLVLRSRHRIHGVSMGAFSVLLLAPLTRVQTLRRLTALPRPRTSPWWNRSWKPIASEHWGEGRSS